MAASHPPHIPAEPHTATVHELLSSLLVKGCGKGMMQGSKQSGARSMQSPEGQTLLRGPANQSSCLFHLETGQKTTNVMHTVLCRPLSERIQVPTLVCCANKSSSSSSMQGEVRANLSGREGGGEVAAKGKASVGENKTTANQSFRRNKFRPAYSPQRQHEKHVKW